MREQFANEVVMRLTGKVSDDDLKVIRDTILATLSNYEIGSRETALTLYQSFVPQFYELYLATLKLNGRSLGTIKTYNFHLVNFFLQLRRPITDITSADIYEYLFSLQEKGTIGNRTLDHIRVIINTFMEWCCDEDYLRKNPCRSIKPIKYVSKERIPLTDYELELVRDHCKDVREAALVELMYCTGCRVTELITLKKEDIDLKNRMVSLFGKGGKYRTSFLNARAEMLLRKYYATRNDDINAVFVTVRKPYRPVSKPNVEKMVRELGERAGLDRRLTPHMFRHTFATNLVRRGARLEDVQRLLGHTKPSTTLIYTKIDMDAIRKEHERYII